MVNSTGSAPRPSFQLLSPHLEAGHELILLKPLSDKQFLRLGEPDPLDIGLTWEEQIRAHMASGGNVGVRINRGMLVIDVDTRGAPEGVSPIRQLENSLGVNLSRGPLVLNGGCGQHFYFKHPDDLYVEDSSPEFPGVKPRMGARAAAKGSPDGYLPFKRSLREFPALTFRTEWFDIVLASGSVHPLTHQHCFCEILQDELVDAPLVPRELLLRIIKKPRYSGFYALGAGIPG
jgi:hypothetical protein